MRNSEIGKEVIKKQLPLIPKLPGVYKMLSINNEILYVGKAKNLPNRLKSYVSEKNHIIRTERMLSQTKKLEITTTSNESEALLLEANLIKKHQPFYNVNLKDDKSFPFIRITNEPFPRVFITREIIKDGSKYFGPYTDVIYLRRTLKAIRRIFPVRSCDFFIDQNVIDQ